MSNHEIGPEVPQSRLDRREAILTENEKGGWHSPSGQLRVKLELAQIAYENLKRPEDEPEIVAIRERNAAA